MMLFVKQTTNIQKYKLKQTNKQTENIHLKKCHYLLDFTSKNSGMHWENIYVNEMSTRAYSLWFRVIAYLIISYFLPYIF